MKTKQKRGLSRIVAAVCVIALLVTGSYAWRGISSALNEFNDRKVINEPGANLHDDFSAATGDKEVYVENTGNADVYVRIQLSDLLAKDTDVAPAYPNYQLFKPGNLAQAGNQFAEGFIWTFGNSSPYDYTSITGSADWAAAADRSAADALVGDQRGDAASGSTIVDLSTLPNDKVAPAGSVISMADYWNAAFDTQRDEFAGWVYDADGYAYWSQALPKGESTSLLLNGVTLPTRGDSTYYYAINVNMEYVDAVDLPAWTDNANIQTGANVGTKAETPTTEAIDMLKGIKARRDLTEFIRGKQVGDVFSASGWDWIVLALDGDGNALVATTNVIGTSAFGQTVNTAPFVGAYIGSTIDTVMGNFYTTLGTNEAGNATLNKLTAVAQPSDYASKITSFADRGNVAAGLSAVATSGTPKCFALSVQEVDTYLAGQPTLFDATKPAAEFIGLGNNYNWSGAEQGYWLRTPAGNYPKTIIEPVSGNVGYSYTLNEARISVRPSLWVSTK
jgi:hypothetical protein